MLAGDESPPPLKNHLSAIVEQDHEFSESVGRNSNKPAVLSPPVMLKKESPGLNFKDLHAPLDLILPQKPRKYSHEFELTSQIVENPSSKVAEPGHVSQSNTLKNKDLHKREEEEVIVKVHETKLFKVSEIDSADLVKQYRNCNSQTYQIQPLFPKKLKEEEKESNLMSSDEVDNWLLNEITE